MLFIKQDSKIDVAKLTGLLYNYAVSEFELSSDIISDDITRLNRLKQRANSNSKYFKESVKNVIDYLNRLYVQSKKGQISIYMYADSKCIYTKPVEVKRIKELNVQFTDYIKINDKNIITLNYAKIIRAIAYEMGHVDYGDETEEVEEKLQDLGIVAVYNNKELFNRVEIPEYKDIAGLGVDMTAYKTLDRNTCTDYFGDKVSEVSKVCRANKMLMYHRVVEESMKRIMAMITLNILSEIEDKGIDAKVAAVYNDSIVIMANVNSNGMKEFSKIDTEVVIRLFGRKFSFHPTIKSY